MGVCNSKTTLKRAGAQKHIEIDFEKLKKYNEERLKSNYVQQQSFCQIILPDHIKNLNTSTQTWNVMQQLEPKKP